MPCWGGAGGAYFFRGEGGEERPVLFADSEGRAALVVIGLPELLRLLLGTPWWRDCRTFTAEESRSLATEYLADLADLPDLPGLRPRRRPGREPYEALTGSHGVPLVLSAADSMAPAPSGTAGWIPAAGRAGSRSLGYVCSGHDRQQRA
ncbi:hypothetical protein [Streptomyces sp. NPDC018967]|uniref:hypothetical protein n=1 Tax=Streptomyces sp. NPDC018967 TaxID=3365059 RepID=UPI0037907A41